MFTTPAVPCSFAFQPANFLAPPFGDITYFLAVFFPSSHEALSSRILSCPRLQVQRFCIRPISLYLPPDGQRFNFFLTNFEILPCPFHTFPLLVHQPYMAARSGWFARPDPITLLLPSPVLFRAPSVLFGPACAWILLPPVLFVPLPTHSFPIAFTPLSVRLSPLIYQIRGTSRLQSWPPSSTAD